MKKTYAFALTAGLLLLGSCAANEPEVPNTAPDSKDVVGYMKIAFSNETTRAETEDGIKDDKVDENTIETAQFLFFGSNNNYLYQKLVKTTPENDDDLLVWVENNPNHVTGNTAHKEKCAVVRVEGDARYVTVVCNGAMTIQANAVQNTLGSSFQNANNKFIMANSVYYGTGNTPTWRVTIDRDNLYQSYDEAVKGATINATINVERMVAKVRILSNTYTTASFNPMAELGEDKQLNNDVTIEFTPVDAMVIGQRSTGYKLKKLPTYSSITDTDWAAFALTGSGRSYICLPGDGTIKDAKYPSTVKETIFGTEDTPNVNVTYVHENGDDANPNHTTSVAVVGYYTVKDKDGNVLGVTEATKATENEPVGTFWVTAMGSNFTVHSSKASVKAVMGCASDAELEKVYEVIENEDGTKTNVWTGWMKATKGDIGIYCMKYQAGKGYYTKPIERYSANGKSYNMITRNHVYELSIDKITGLGVGLPKETDNIIPVDPIKPSDQTFYLHLSVNVLPWQVVTQSVEW